MLYIGQKYFEGYEEKFILKKNGHGLKKVRMYLGDTYHMDTTVALWRAKKLLVAGLTVLFFAALLYGGTLRTHSNNSTLVMLPYAIGLLAGCYCTIGVFHFVLKKFNMTVFEYNEFRKQINLGSTVSLCAMAAAALAGGVLIVHLYFTDGASFSALKTELIPLCANLLCALTMLAINTVEKRSKYVKLPRISTEE